MPRKPWSPTKEQLQIIEEMSSKGASQSSIAKELDINYSTWIKYRDKSPNENHSENHSENHENQSPIKKALEAGEKSRTERIASNIEDAMEKSAHGFFVDEVEEYVKVHRIQDEEGNTVKEWEEVDRRVKRKKFISPNTTMQMFLAANTLPGKYQSINKVEVKQDNNQIIETPVINWTVPKNDNPQS